MTFLYNQQATDTQRLHNDEMPEGWAECQLSDVIYVQNGYAFPSEDYRDTGVPLIRQTNLAGDKLLLEKCVFLDPSYLQSKKDFVLRKGDILVGMSGSLGKICIYDLDYPALQNQRTGRIVPYSEDALIREYFYYFLQTVKNELQAKGKGLGVSNISASDIETLSFRLAPITEQERIVAKVKELLARVNTAKGRLAKVLVILKRFRQAVLAAACSGRLTADWRATKVDIEPADQLVERIFSKRQQEYTADCKTAKAEGKKPPKKPNNLEPRRVETPGLPEIPDEWTWIHLPELGYMSRGKSKHRPRNAPYLFGGPYPFIQTGDIAQSGGRITSHRQTYSEAGLAQSHLWSSGTVCITIAANIANSAILTYPACFPDSIVGLTPDEALSIKEYVEFFIRTARSNLDQFAPATAQKNINIEILSDVAVPLPPLAEQKEIVRRVQAMFKLAEAVEKRVAVATRRAEKLTQAILAKAFRGELVPTEAELARREARSYETASELLSQIKSHRESEKKKHSKKK